jgi:hypothetical protein
VITVTAYANGVIIGGMSYDADPDIKKPREALPQKSIRDRS